jgi:hypothetical protein
LKPQYHPPKYLNSGGKGGPSRNKSVILTFKWFGGKKEETRKRERERREKKRKMYMQIDKQLWRDVDAF